MTTLDGKKRVVTVHSLCAFRYVAKCKEKELNEERAKTHSVAVQFNYYTSQLQQRVRELEMQQSRLVDSQRYQAAAALLQMRL